MNDSSRNRASNPNAGKGRPSSAPEEQVRVRAYEIYLARGAEPGREVEDWVQAERELRGETVQVARGNGQVVTARRR